MRSYPPQYSRSSTPLNPSPSLFIFLFFPFFLPPPFSHFPPFFSTFFLALFSLSFLFSFLSLCTALFFSSPFSFPFFFYSFCFLFLCVCVRAFNFVCMCVRIWQFHVCQPMITSRIQNQILNMCLTRKYIK